MEQIVFIGILLVLGYVFGSLAESAHYKSLRNREKQLQNLPAVTVKSLPADNQLFEKAEPVQGNAVISLDYFKRIMAMLRNLVGGSIGSYESLIDRARREATLRMKEPAGKADLIVNLRIETSAIGYSADRQRAIGSIEAIAYGTAITFSPQSPQPGTPP